MTEKERVYKEALLTDEEILKIYENRNWRIFEPDLTRAQVIAQEQLGKVLKTDGIEIRADDTSLPENFWTSKQIDEPITEYDRIKGAGFDAAIRNMLKAGFIRVIPKEK